MHWNNANCIIKVCTQYLSMWHSHAYQARVDDHDATIACLRARTLR